MNRCFFMLMCAILLFFTSCDTKLAFEENKAIENAVWRANAPAHFEFEMKDTLALHNFYVNLRNGENYAYSNIFLFVEMEFPNGKKSIDTVACSLADPTGKWKGTGMGDIYDNRFLYQENKQFPLAGRYKVDIFQGMRVDELEGIYDVGFRLARSK